MDNIKIYEPFGNSDHSQIHFDIKVKSESRNKKIQEKGKYKDMIKILSKARNKTLVKCWKILKYEIESIIDQFVPLKK